MKTTFAAYEHTPIGLPKIKLRWSEENGKANEARIVVSGAIAGSWTWHHPNPSAQYAHECKMFDEWAWKNYGSVENQG